MGSLNDMWGTPPPTLRNFLQHCLYFSCSLLCQSVFYTAEGVSQNNKTSGHWTGCAVTLSLSLCSLWEDQRGQTDESNLFFGKNSLRFARNSYEFPTNFVQISQNLQYSHTFIPVKFVRNSYKIRMNFM